LGSRYGAKIKDKSAGEMLATTVKTMTYDNGAENLNENVYRYKI
jgi:hypothetical protein